MLTKTARRNALKQARKWKDFRLSWRDPSMPVLREYTFANGVRKTHVDPDYESRYRAHRLDADDTPNYRRDPTYNLRRKK